MKVKGSTFEVKEYAFSETPEGSTDKFKTMDELFDKYTDNRDTYLDESLNLYVDVRNISRKYVSLVTVKDHAQNTLNLVVDTKNEVVEMRLNLENIHVPDMIHLHKQTGEVIQSDLLKENLKVSRLQSTKIKIENQLRQERVENKARLNILKIFKEIY